MFDQSNNILALQGIAARKDDSLRFQVGYFVYDRQCSIGVDGVLYILWPPAIGTFLVALAGNVKIDR